jgi:hypothetical protein
MPSSHSRYLELKLETGRIGWVDILGLFIYSSLHLLERVRRKDAVLAWYWSELFAVLINLLDSIRLSFTHFWPVYLFVVAESVRSPDRARQSVSGTRKKGGKVVQRWGAVHPDRSLLEKGRQGGPKMGSSSPGDGLYPFLEENLGLRSGRKYT